MKRSEQIVQDLANAIEDEKDKELANCDTLLGMFRHNASVLAEELQAALHEEERQHLDTLTILSNTHASRTSRIKQMYNALIAQNQVYIDRLETHTRLTNGELSPTQTHTELDHHRTEKPPYIAYASQSGD